MGPELGGRLSADGDPDDGSGVATGADAPAAAAVAAVKSHTFIEHDVADLRVGDVPQLLAEYKRLARAFDILAAQAEEQKEMDKLLGPMPKAAPWNQPRQPTIEERS